MLILLPALLFAGDEGCHDVNVTKQARTENGSRCSDANMSGNNVTSCPTGQNFTETRYPAERACQTGFTYKGCTSHIGISANIEHYLYWCELGSVRVTGVKIPLPSCNKSISPQPSSTESITINDAEGSGGVCQCPTT
jgi:hypothetical protein